MNFGEAIARMKIGSHMRRAGWNGKRQHVYLEDWLEGKFAPGGRVYAPCFVLFTEQGEHQPGWLASQADMLADDWELVFPKGQR